MYFVYIAIFVAIENMNLIHTDDINHKIMFSMFILIPYTLNMC